MSESRSAPDFEDWKKWELLESFAAHWYFFVSKNSKAGSFLLEPRLRGEGEQETRIGVINRYRYPDNPAITGSEAVIFGQSIIRRWGFKDEEDYGQQMSICVEGQWENITINGKTFKFRPEFSDDGKANTLVKIWVDIFRADGALDNFFALEPRT